MASRKRIYFNRSYGKYMQGDLVTVDAAYADNLVRRGFCALRPLESKDASGADDRDGEAEPDVETPAPASPPEDLAELRAQAKEAGIRGYHLMKEETLLERLTSADEEE